MSNVYRAPVLPESTSPRDKSPTIQEMREENSALEFAAAQSNLRIATGIKCVPNPQNKDNPWRQPFWYVYQWGECTGVYIEAERVRTQGSRGELRLHFKTAEAKEHLRQMLVNYRPVKNELSIIQFGSRRGFDIKTTHPQPGNAKKS